MRWQTSCSRHGTEVRHMWRRRSQPMLLRLTRSSTGVYVVTFAEPHPRGDSYTVLATIPAGGFVMWSKTATSLTFSAYSTNGQLTDPAEVNFTTIP